MSLHPDHPGAGFAGISELARAAATGDMSGLKKARIYTEYTLPLSLAGDAWESSGFEDKDRIVRMVELTAGEQETAAELGGSSGLKISREMLYASLYQIGDWHPRKDRRKLESWWNCIGPKWTNLLQTAFMKMQSVEEEDVESFLSSGAKGRG